MSEAWATLATSRRLREKPQAKTALPLGTRQKDRICLYLQGEPERDLSPSHLGTHGTVSKVAQIGFADGKLLFSELGSIEVLS